MTAGLTPELMLITIGLLAQSALRRNDSVEKDSIEKEEPATLVRIDSQ